MHRHALTDDQWRRLQAVLPKQKAGPEATRGDRLFIEAVIRQLWGSSAQPLTPPPAFAGFIEYGPILTTTYRAAVLLITVAILIALWAFLSFTPGLGHFDVDVAAILIKLFNAIEILLQLDFIEPA